MKQLLFFLYIFPLALHGISYHKRIPKNEKRSLPAMYRKKKSNGMLCTLRVEGVECGLCAQSVIDILNNFDGIEEATFKNIGLDYSESVVEFFWTKKNENIAFNEIQKKIEKEGFEFTFLVGTFYGLFEHKENANPAMLLNTLNISVVLKNIPEKMFKKKEIVLNGKISKEKKRGYIFTLS